MPFRNGQKFLIVSNGFWMTFMIGNVTRNASFGGIARYIFSKPGAETLLENVPEGRTVIEKAASMQWVASRNERVKRPAYHLSLSPAFEDELSRGEWSMFCGQVLSELGFQHHQVLVGLHHDVKYPDSEKTRTHAHLLINLVDDAGACANTDWDYFKIPKVLRHLERSYKLQPVSEVGASGRQQDTFGQYRAEERSSAIAKNKNEVDTLPGTKSTPPTVTSRSIRRKLQDIIDEAVLRSSSFAELSNLMESWGVQVNNTEQGWWMQYSNIAFAGHQLGRKYTRPAVCKRLESVPMVTDKDDTSISSMRDVFLTNTPDTDWESTESQPEVISDTAQTVEQQEVEKLQKPPKPKVSIETPSSESKTTEEPEVLIDIQSDDSPTTQTVEQQEVEKLQKPQKPKLKSKVSTEKPEVSEPTTQAPSSESKTTEEPEVLTDIQSDDSPTTQTVEQQEVKKSQKSPKPKLKSKVSTETPEVSETRTQAPSSESKTIQEPEVPIGKKPDDLPITQTVDSDSESTESQNLGELVIAPGNLIEMMKQQANRLEQSDYIDGRFYAGMFLDATAHLAEIVEVAREVWSEGQEQETEMQLEDNFQPPNEIPQIEGDDDWLNDEEALHDFDQRLSDSTEPSSSDVLINVQENPIAVAESLSQFIHARAAVHDLSVDEPIETNLGTLRFTSDEGSVSITQNITLARWDEDLQEWEFDKELADLHKDNVERLLNNQAIETKGYQISDETIIFEQVQFRAKLTDDGWQVTDNSLSTDEQQRITRLPQSEEEYTRSVDAKDLLDYFQHRAPEQFMGDVGSIHWKSESESFDRIFEITKQSDRAVVEGFDLTQTDDWGNPRKIFSASIDNEGSIQCSQCEIPTADIDYLLAQESQHREDKPEMER